MGRFNWGFEGPPKDAYSRVTDPERFRPLHDWGLEAVARLQENYEVTRDEGEGMDTELEGSPLSRPTLKLAPLQDTCAPVTIAFNDFPGLAVRYGRWATEWFPTCGYDACDEMPDEEFERFTELLSDVVAGRFREALSGGDGWSRNEFWSADHRIGGGGSRVPREEAAQILNGSEEVVLEWMPWPPRPDRGGT